MSALASRTRTPYEQHRAYVLGVVASRCPWVQRVDREALYHDAYASMLELERDGRLDPPTMHPRQLRAYLAKAAVRKALDERKRAENRLTVPLGPAAENRPDPARPLEERVVGALDAGAIRELVAELGARQRAVLQLRFALELDPAEIQAALGISARAYRKDLERAVRHLARRYELVRNGRWCESRRSLILAYVTGVAGPRRALEARAHLAACPGCARMAGELRQASERAAALLPLPDIAARGGGVHRVSEFLTAARESIAELGGGAKQHAAGLVSRASDPTPLAGARPGAAAAAIAGCLAVGSGATYCAVEGIPDPLRAPLGLQRRADDRVARPAEKRARPVRPRASQAEAPSPVVQPPPDPPATEQPAPEPPSPPPAAPATPPETDGVQANREFGIEQTAPGGADSEFAAPARPSGDTPAAPGGEFGP